MQYQINYRENGKKEEKMHKKGKIYLDRQYEIGEVDKRIYSSMIEHMERVVYGGIYEPDHPLADEDGFRKDVIEMVKELQIPMIRYPGGNFLSGYNWEDGIGPVKDRPVRLDLAWTAEEPNLVGTDEYMRWAAKTGTEVNMAVNLGTRGADAARNLVEYCNYEGGSYWSDLRKKNGAEKPYGIKTWCLGNEMDGTWQIGHKKPKEYGRLAVESGRLMKKVDKKIELVLCGSSNTDIATYPSWDAKVLEEAYEVTDYISLHNYFTIVDSNMKDFLAGNIEMERQIKTIIAACDYVKAKVRGTKDIHLSFDEWGIWNREETANRAKWKFDWSDKNAVSEGSYSFADALLTGAMLMSLINHCDRVKIACQAQLVNHLSLFNCVKGGGVWKQTIFYPFLYTSRYGRGTALKTITDCPAYSCECYERVPVLENAAVLNEEKRNLTVFVLNRDQEEDMETDLIFRGFENLKEVEHIVYHSDDPEAVNTPQDPKRVVPYKKAAGKIEKERYTTVLEKNSWHVIRFEYE